MVPRASLDGCGKFDPTGIRSPDRPDRSESLYLGPQVSQKSRSRFKILGAIRCHEASSILRTDRQTLDTTLQNGATQKNWRPGFFTHQINKHSGSRRIDEYVRIATVILYFSF